MKNFELFLVICIFPFVFSLLINFIGNNLLLKILGYVASIIGFMVLFLWMNSIRNIIIVNLNRKKYIINRMLDIVNIIVIILIAIFLVYVSIYESISNISQVIIISIAVVILLNYIYSTITTAIFIKRYELGENAILTIEEYGSTFILLVFFPIGIWILQPKINQMINKNQ
jgi:small-conductance mechanosensitive channel